MNKIINNEEGYDSNDEIVLESNNENYKISCCPTHSNKKRLLCHSTINNEECPYKNFCTYAHTLNEQNIDSDKKIIYQMILDKNLAQYINDTNIFDIYKNLLHNIKICDTCIDKKCTGGYNCRNGIFCESLKICRNDLLTGNCLNKIISISIDKHILEKINNIELLETYEGCINGHHLSIRGLLPYYKILNDIEKANNNEKVKAYIEKNQDYSSLDTFINESETSSDEEINSWLKRE